MAVVHRRRTYFSVMKMKTLFAERHRDFLGVGVDWMRKWRWFPPPNRSWCWRTTSPFMERSLTPFVGSNGEALKTAFEPLRRTRAGSFRGRNHGDLSQEGMLDERGLWSRHRVCPVPGLRILCARPKGQRASAPLWRGKRFYDTLSVADSAALCSGRRCYGRGDCRHHRT